MWVNAGMRDQWPTRNYHSFSPKQEFFLLVKVIYKGFPLVPSALFSI
jgi:hypothetical protein